MTHEVHKKRPTKFKKIRVRECLRARGFLITAPSSVCVPDVIGALAVWIQIQQKKRAGPGQPALVPGCGEFRHYRRRDRLVEDAPVTIAVTEEPSE